MNVSRNTEIKVGIVSLAALILLILGISMGKGLRFSAGESIIKLRFPASGGIQASSPVVVNGVDRGDVKSIENNNGSVLITASIDNIDDLREDAHARITILEITGGKKIEIFPGTSPNKLKEGSEIQGTTPPDLSELVALFGEVSGDAIGLVRRLDTIAAGVTYLLEDGKLADDIKVTVSNLKNVSANANTLLDDNYNNIQNSLNNLAIITQDLKIAIKNNEPKVSNIIAELENTIKDIKPIINKTDNAIANADKLILDLNSIASEVKDGEGFANKLIYDKKFAGTLDSALTDIYKFIKFIEEHGVNVNLRLGTRP